MLVDATVMATVAVKNREEGKQFYAETLGLTVVDDDMGGVTFQSGAGKLFMYESPAAGSGQATAATWLVDDVSAVAADLEAKGVPFEHYDMPDATWEGSVMVMGDMKAAWLKDPSGNVLCLASA